jgi:hypothetical protein
VAVDEHLERCFVAARDESIQQFGIPDLGSCALAGHPAEVTDDALQLTGRHGIPPAP